MILNSEIWSLILLNAYGKSEIVHLAQTKPVAHTNVLYMKESILDTEER
jgi:hypothetical protein